jgi:DNA adenine methylase
MADFDDDFDEEEDGVLPFPPPATESAIGLFSDETMDFLASEEINTTPLFTTRVPLRKRKATPASPPPVVPPLLPGDIMAELDESGGKVFYIKGNERFYSVLRYPGGKNWFLPVFRAWLSSFAEKPQLIDLFSGGGSIGLSAVIDGLAANSTMVELDEDVANIWLTMLSKRQAPELMDMVRRFKMSRVNFDVLLKQDPKVRLEAAFRALVWNRVSWGGIMNAGSWVAKRGENDQGLLSRWYPDEIIRRVGATHEQRGNLKFVRGDVLSWLPRYAECAEPDTVFFIDPPTPDCRKDGNRLYKHHEIDHGALFALCAELPNFLLMYGNSPETLNLVKEHGFAYRRIGMKSNHHVKKCELMIGRDFAWFDNLPIA